MDRKFKQGQKLKWIRGPADPDTIIITGGTDEEPILKKSLQTIQYVDLSSGSSNKPLKKENKMKTLNRIRALARRLTMAWDLYGVFLLLRLAHPLVTRLWSRIGIPVDTVADREVAPWILTVLTVGASVFTILGLHKLAAWYYGERK